MSIQENCMGLSIDMFEGIPLYRKFLEHLAQRLKPLLKRHKKEQLNFINQCFLKLKQKATVFVDTFSKDPLADYNMGDDVLFGLHLIYLDNYYCPQEPKYFLRMDEEQWVPRRIFTPSINFSHLLNNRTLQQSDIFPQNLTHDLLQELIDNKGTAEPEPNIFENVTPLEFIKEHVVELSQVISKKDANSMESWIASHLKEYLSKLKKTYSHQPEKSVDLFFHFHMLHPNNFRQDSIRVAGFLQDHVLATKEKKCIKQ